MLDYDYEIFYLEELHSNTSKLYQSALLTFFGIFLYALTDFFENSSAIRAMTLLFNAVETESNNKLQARKQNAKLWFNFDCHFPSMRGGLVYFDYCVYLP